MALRVAISGLLWVPVLLQAGPRTQAPDARWLTFTTAHYRIHCPEAFQAFGADVASRVEGVHAQYLDLVGYVHPRPIDVVILDPVREANGMALPILTRPHVVLWRTEPEPDSVIGHHRGWAELLLTHELGHMHHLLRPARKPTLWQRWTAALGPVAQKAPRWVTEGYATLIEGKLTGSGRPHSALRAAVLRQWALEGKLPPYEALSGTQGFLGGSMAYLVGSGYLAWLESRSGDPKILPGLWTRLAGRRDFEASFLATFGFSPRDGYQRYCAELTHTALELERRVRAEGVREGELVTQLKGWATDLAVSPDGTRIMARVLDPRRPGLYVWNLQSTPQPKPATPGELPDHAPSAPVRPPDWRLGRVDGALPWQPRWTGPATLTYQLRLPDAEGVLQPVPRTDTLPVLPASAPGTGAVVQPGWREVAGIWNLVDAQGRPLTRTLAAAWNPVATPDGKWIYYTQLSATGLQLRRLDASLPPLADAPLPADPSPLVPDQALPRPDEASPLPPPAPVPAHPYRPGESHQALFLAGYSATPAGTSAQLGLGGNDVLGRLNWQVLAGLGDGAGPRGAMAGAAWRGWGWAPALHLFSLLERPSAQRFGPVQGLDRERRGVELAFESEDLGRPRAWFRPHLAFERSTLADGTARERSLLGGEASLGNHWSRDDQGVLAGVAVQEQWGRTQGQAWRLHRLSLLAGWLNPWVPLRVRAEAGRVEGQPTTLDLFQLGGVATSLLPAALDANRVAQPALPAATATGNRLARLRGELGFGLLQAYVEHAVVWQDSASRPAAQRVVGLELDSRRLGIPQDLLRRLAGNLTFTLGVHRPLDGPMKDRTVGTLSVLLRP